MTVRTKMVTKKKKVLKKKPKKKKKNGKKEPKRKPDFTVDEIAAAIKKARGYKTVAADLLGCTYRTIVNYFNRHPELNDIRLEAEERMLDMVEGKMVTKAVGGHFDAQRFIMKTKGKRRGYIESHHNINQPMEGGTLTDLIEQTFNDAEDKGEDLVNGDMD